MGNNFYTWFTPLSLTHSVNSAHSKLVCTATVQVADFPFQIGSVHTDFKPELPPDAPAPAHAEGGEGGVEGRGAPPGHDRLAPGHGAGVRPLGGQRHRGRDAPGLDGGVAGAREEEVVPVRPEHAVDDVRVPAQGLHRHPALHLPEHDGHVPRGGGQEHAVPGEGQPLHGPGVPLQALDVDPQPRVPQLDDAVGGAGGHPGLVRAEDHALNAVCVAHSPPVECAHQPPIIFSNLCIFVYPTSSVRSPFKAWKYA
mmetsp:Transcript_58821/g.86098  ORF Transcript_58821/g.86098 Transcript_58821/m.86098 type:complete len:254 (+) Transcript_58821:248-1009(+)